jgi:hypothetical protein
MNQILMAQFQIATYDGSDLIRTLVNKFVGKWVLLLIAPFIIISSIGVLNLIVGVMLCSAIALTDVDASCQEGTFFLMRHQALKLLREALILKCTDEAGDTSGSPPVTRQLLMDWWRAAPHDEMMATTMSGAKEEGGQEAVYSQSASDYVQSHQDNQALDMQQMLAAAEVTDEDITVIFNELDTIVGSTRPVSVDEFIEGCMWMKGSVHPMDVMK